MMAGAGVPYLMRDHSDGEPTRTHDASFSRSIQDYYDVGSRLTAEACGGGGEVLLGVRKNDGQRFAIKVCLSEHVIGCAYIC